MHARFALFVVLALAVAPAASASVVRDTTKEHESRVAYGSAADVPVLVPFHLEAPGLFYAKLLATPWNAVNSGSPNGTVKADHSAGESGWWVELYLADGAGAPLTADGNGAPASPALGAYVDSTPTPTTFLAAGTPYALQAIVHVPEAASVPGARYEVNLALVYREGAFTGDGAGSGARLEQSKAFTEKIVVEGTAPPSTPPTSPTPGATPTGDPAKPTPTDPAPTPGDADEPPVEVRAGGVPPDASLLLWAVLAIATLALAVSAAALAVTSYVVVLLRREVRALRAELSEREARDSPAAASARNPRRAP